MGGVGKREEREGGRGEEGGAHMKNANAYILKTAVDYS